MVNGQGGTYTLFRREAVDEFLRNREKPGRHVFSYFRQHFVAQKKWGNSCPALPAAHGRHCLSPQREGTCFSGRAPSRLKAV